MKRLVVAMLLAMAPGVVLAQRITAPVETATGGFRGDADLLKHWTSRYLSIRNDQESALLLADITAKLNAAQLRHPNGASYDLDFRCPHSIVLLAEVGGVKTLVRLLVWKGHALYETNLQGAENLFEVFIAPGALELSSLYTSTPVEDPRAAEISGALKQLASTISVQPSVAAEVASKAEVSYSVRIGSVVLPVRRGKISIKSQVLVEKVSSKVEKESVKSEATYDNVSLQWIGFSGIGAGIIRLGGARRDKIDNGAFVEDSFDGVATIAAVNFHPGHFDPTQLPISWKEQWRGFVGIVATPELGLAAGLGWAPFRALSVNAGLAWLRVRTRKAGVALQQTPMPAQPFARAQSRAVVFGAGYKFS